MSRELNPVNLTHLDQTPSEKRKDTRGRKKKAERIRVLWLNMNEGKRQQWQTKSQKGYDFFLNAQLTQEEEDMLKDAGMPTFIINRVTPIIETMKFFVTANNPRWKAVGTGGEDVDLAEVHNDVIDYCWYQSSGRTLFSEVVQESLTKGKGYFHIYVDPDADRGMGEVKFERVDPFQVYTSSMSRDYLERDATVQIIKKDLPREHLLKKLPQFENLIMKAHGERDGNAYTDRDVDGSDSFQPDDVETPYRSAGQLTRRGEPDTILQYYELYEPIRVKYYNLTVSIPPPEAEMEEAKEGIDAAIKQFSDELQVEFLEKEQQLRQQLRQGEIIPERYELELEKAKKMMSQAVQEQRAILYNKAKEEASKVEQKVVTEEEYEKIKGPLGDKILDAIPYFERRIKKECAVGDIFLYEQVLNISHSPLIPLPYLHTQTPYPMSAVIPLVGKQQEINKSHQIMVHNANLSSNLRWLHVEGEIDEDEWERYSGSPGALLKYRQGFSANGPREIMPQNINNAFFTIEQDSKSDMEYIAGIQPPSMGISSEKDETYRGFLAKDEYGTRRIRSWISNVVEPALEHLGKVFHEYAKDIYSIHKVFRIVQPNPGGGYEERELEINVPLYDSMGAEIGRWNDYASTRMDIRFVAGSTLPVNRWAVLEEYKQYLEMGVIDDIAFIQETDIKNKESLMNRKSMLAQAQQQIESQEENIKQLKGDIDTLRRQILQMGLKDELSKAKIEVDRAKTETKAMDKLVQERMRDALKQARDEMKLEIQKLSNEVKAKTSAAKRVLKLTVPSKFIHGSRILGRVLEYYGGFSNVATNIITCCPRSGSRYIARLLVDSGLDIMHEALRPDGVVSWQHIAGKEMKVECNNVIHLVREPLSTIASIGWVLERHAWNFIKYFIPFDMEDDEIQRNFHNRMLFAMHIYENWNALIEERAKHRFRLEDIRERWDELIGWLNILPTDPVWPEGKVNVIPHAQVKWLDLVKVDDELAEKCAERAKKYGYF